MSYANGLAPESALVLVDGIHVLPSIAPRIRALIQYAAARNRELHIARKYGGYRQRLPLAGEQEAVYAAGATGGSSVSVAKPGSSSHGWYEPEPGRVDLVFRNNSYTAEELAWLVPAAALFGLVREFGAHDPNHFVASGSFAGGSTPIPLTESEVPDMFRLVNVGGNSAFMVGPSGLRVAIPPSSGDGQPNYILRLCIRVLNSTNAGDVFYASELDVVAALQKAVTPGSAGGSFPTAADIAAAVVKAEGAALSKG